MENNPAFLARFHRDKIIAPAKKLEDLEILQSSLDGLRISKYLQRADPSADYICPVSIFFDEFTEVRM